MIRVAVFASTFLVNFRFKQLTNVPVNKNIDVKCIYQILKK